MFKDLYSETSRAISSIYYGTIIKNNDRRATSADAINKVMQLYLSYSPDPRLSRLTLWHNPEEFLQRLSDVTENFTDANPIRLRVIESIPSNLTAGAAEKIRTLAGRMAIASAKIELAAEVSSFLRGNKFQSECWDPYVKWLKCLRPGFDQIITFNYDEAIENLNENIGGECPLYVPLPHEETIPADRVPLFKLHGSTGWKQHIESGAVSLCNDFGATIQSEEYTVGILIPGAEKLKAHARPIWRLAMNAIETTQNLEFIGYRFPETDMVATSEILRAIRVKGGKLINVVLGPSTGDPHIQRVKGLFDNTNTGTHKSTLQSLYAQDHISNLADKLNSQTIRN